MKRYTHKFKKKSRAGQVVRFPMCTKTFFSKSFFGSERVVWILYPDGVERQERVTMGQLVSLRKPVEVATEGSYDN